MVKRVIVEALGIDQYQEVKDLAKRRQIFINASPEVETMLTESSFENYRREQHKLDYIK